MSALATNLPTKKNTVPLALWVCAFSAGAAAVALSPTLLIALGPMRGSLTSDNPLTRQTAEMTVLGARIGCALLAMFGAVLIRKWAIVSESAPVRAIRSHVIPSTDRAVQERFSGPGLVGLAVGALALLYYLFIESWFSKATQIMLGREDGPIEQLTALFFLLAGIVGVFVILTERRVIQCGDVSARAVSIRRTIWLSLLVLFFVFACGEEISWGQRIFGFQTPDSIGALNVQNETNLHNMMGYLADHLFILGVLVYGAIVPFLANRSDFWGRALHYVGIPVASQGLAAAFLLASLIQSWAVGALVTHPTSIRIAELRELGSGFGFLLLMIEARTSVNLRLSAFLPKTGEALAPTPMYSASPGNP